MRIEVKNQYKTEEPVYQFWLEGDPERNIIYVYAAGDGKTEQIAAFKANPTEGADKYGKPVHSIDARTNENCLFKINSF